MSPKPTERTSSPAFRPTGRGEKGAGPRPRSAPATPDQGTASGASPGRRPIRGVVGLGNPGARYDGTRHNIGFEAVTALLGNRRFVRRHFDGGVLVETEIAGSRVSLLRPTSYMNRSGVPVRRFVESDRLPLAALLLVCDDYALPLGTIRTRLKGSDGGHNGLASVFRALGTSGVARMRLGIGAPPSGADPADFVLSRFEREESESVGDLLERAVQAIETAVTEGLETAMNRFNGTPR